MPTRRHGGGAAGEDYEDRLEGVFGGLGVADDAPADAVDHRSVAADQDFECDRVAVGHERREELAVGPGDRLPGQHGPAEVGHDSIGERGHGGNSEGGGCPAVGILPADGAALGWERKNPAPHFSGAGPGCGERDGIHSPITG